MPLIALILLPFIGSLMAAVLPANARNTESTLAGLIALVCFVQAALFFPEIANGGVLRQEIPWLPALGLNIVVRMDGFAWMFCMLVFGIGADEVLHDGKLTRQGVVDGFDRLCPQVRILDLAGFLPRGGGGFF